MIAPIRPAVCQDSNLDCNARFLDMLPQIEQQANHALRDLPASQREEYLQEIVANCFAAFVRLVEQGKQHLAYPTPLTYYAVAQVRQGRLVGGRLNAKEILSPYAQRRHGFVVEPLDRCEQFDGHWREALVEDRRTPVPDQVAFRIDFPAWLATLPRRHRRVAQALSLGHTTSEVARQFRLSAGRVSQLRREMHAAWLAFHDEQPDAAEASQKKGTESRMLTATA